ncbi:MAG: heavy metal translocating P-type ATPase [Bdellovibrionales bacterium]|nr:heavy metal translocating P-type ATPase [Bdellovibrionales bacterium]
MKNLKFEIVGMTCAACSGIIEKETKLLKGIESAQVNFATETGEFKTNDDFDLDVFHALLKKLGYRAIDKDQKKSEKKTTIFNRDLIKALTSVILASLTMFFAMVVPNNTIQALLATILVFGFGLPYVKAVLKFHFNMNMLIGLGVLSSYIYSWFLILNSPHAHSYFEGGAFIIAFSIVGHYFDNLAKTKARSNLSSLYKMQIKFATKILEGTEVNTPVIEIKTGDIIRLKPGEKFPLDGEIISGETHADESMISGESQAVSKTIGSSVFAGSMNLEGSVNIKITTTLHQTFISEIVSFVERAQLKKAPIEKYADKIVKVFVPIVLVISFLTFVSWLLLTNDLGMAVSHMVSVLVIACPCALGLAVPMAIMISTSEAAKNGLLISGGNIVEKGSHIDTIVFDKTGTLTEGRPELSKIHLFDESMNMDIVLSLAASSLQYSTHPLSQSIANFALKKQIKLTDPDKFKSLTGLGVVAQIGDKSLALGNADLIKQDNADEIIPESFFQENVGSYVFMSLNKKLVAAFIINDPIKTDSIILIKKLKEQNIDVWMLTGDHEGVAHKIGLELGILPSNIRAGVKPVDKANFITHLQKNNKKVAMIGDGINDAPALSKADLSMAMSNGSDVALEASDVSLLEGKIILVSDFFKRSQRTMRVIKENLILSFLYNLLCIPLAAGVFYPVYKVSLTPMWASLAMGLSSFSVIINSFRVKKLS